MVRLGYKVEILQEFKQLFLTQIQSKSYFLEKGPSKCVKIYYINHTGPDLEVYAQEIMGEF